MGSIELDKITFSYGAAEAEPLFVDFSLKIPAGEWVAVIGPSGAGKTTLFRMITGEEHPDGGTFRIGDTVHFPYLRSRLLKTFGNSGIMGDFLKFADANLEAGNGEPQRGTE